jgi:anion-transporting  ArsA/GET3 family ATPase
VSALSELLDRRLVVVSGKGGVGKTVISSALGLLASRQGKNVLLVKMDDQGRTAQLFGVTELGERVTPLRESVSGIHLDPAAIVADYFHRQLRIRRLVHHIMQSRLFQNWFRVSPAIKEMICLGKVWDLVEERSWWRQAPVWDLVVFDAPATGHGLGLLQLPEQASKLLMGPMRTNALGVQAMLENPRTTSLLIVTIPEEMPVNEAIHFYDQARAKLGVQLAGVILNQVYPERLDEAALARADAVLAGEGATRALTGLLGEPFDPPAARAAVREAASYSHDRRLMTERYREQLRTAIDLPLYEVPHVFAESFGWTELERVSAALGRALEPTTPVGAAGARGAPA